MPTTQYIVLAKRPYQESALLLSGFSPDYGRLELLAHGAQKIGAKAMPVADLFRELEIEYQPGTKSDLGTLKEAELATDFSALAEQPRHFLFAGKAANFMLKNGVPDSPLPFTYDALRSILGQLALPADTPAEERWTLVQCAVVLKLTYLYENGLLPESTNEQQNDFLEQIVAAGVENTPLPGNLDPYFQTLLNWLNNLLDYHQLAR